MNVGSSTCHEDLGSAHRYNWLPGRNLLFAIDSRGMWIPDYEHTQNLDCRPPAPRSMLKPTGR